MGNSGHDVNGAYSKPQHSLSMTQRTVHSQAGLLNRKLAVDVREVTPSEPYL